MSANRTRYSVTGNVKFNKLPVAKPINNIQIEYFIGKTTLLLLNFMKTHIYYLKRTKI